MTSALQTRRTYRHTALTHCRILTVASGKGGVGKTQLAVNLASSFARAGRRVLLVDADLGLANANLLLGLSSDFNASHIVAGTHTVEQVRIRYDDAFDVLPGGHSLVGLAELDVDQQVRWVERLRLNQLGYDDVIIDAGAGIGGNVRLSVALAHETMVVMNPETTSLTDAYALIKVARNLARPGRYKVVVNRVESAAQAREIFECLESACRSFLSVEVELAGYVYRDEVVERALRSQRPFVEAFPSSAAARCVGALAKRFMERN
ncbi:MAG: AAA family ATPase [Myxococcota bacterium]